MYLMFTLNTTYINIKQVNVTIYHKVVHFYGVKYSGKTTTTYNTKGKDKVRRY